MPNTVYDKIAESFIHARKTVEGLFPKPPPPTSPYPFSEYFQGQMPKAGEEEEEEEEGHKEPWTKVIPWFPTTSEAKPIEPGVRMTPEGAVWKEGIPLSIGDVDPQTGEFKPAKWAKGLDIALTVPRLVGKGMFAITGLKSDEWASIRAQHQSLIGERDAELAKVGTDIERKAIYKKYIPRLKAIDPVTSPEFEKRFQELPWYKQLMYESPFWFALGVAGISATALRGALAGPAQVGRAAAVRVPAQAARGALAPVAAVEAVPGVVLKYGIVWPVKQVAVKGVGPALKKSFELALDRGLDRWLVRQGIRADQAPKVVEFFIKKNGYWLFEQGKKNLLKRRASKINVNQRAAMAAEETVAQAEPKLLAAVMESGVRPAAAPPTRPAVAPEVAPQPPRAPTAPVKLGVEEPWTMSASTYQAKMGVHQPHIAEISPSQYAGLSKRGKVDYDKKRTVEWQASADVKTEWREKVLAAYQEGRITLESPGLSEEAKSAITLGRIREREVAAEQALKDALERNRITSIDNVNVGDRVHDVMSRQYGTITKKFKNSVRFKLDEPFPAMRGRPPTTEITVNARALEWQSYNDVKAAVDLAIKESPPAVPIPKAEVGEPEAGLQPSMLEEVPFKEVRPAGAGIVTQAQMDDYLKLQDYAAKVEPEGISAELSGEIAKANGEIAALEAELAKPRVSPAWGNKAAVRKAIAQNQAEIIIAEALVYAQSSGGGPAGLDVAMRSIKTEIAGIEQELGLRTIPFHGGAPASAYQGMPTPSLDAQLNTLNNFVEQVELGMSIPPEAVPGAVPGAKEPWQMTLEEVGQAEKTSMIQEIEADIASGVADETAPQALADIRGMAPLEIADKATHKIIVRQALKDGKPVPAEVLADFPDLKPSVAEAPPLVTPTEPPAPPAPPAPPVPPTVPETVPPGGRMMGDLQDFSEVADIAFKPDAWRSIANLPVIRNLMNTFGPAATANTPPAQALVGRAMLRHEGQQKTQGVISHLNRLGTQEEVFGKLDEKGLIAEGPLKGVTVNTIRTYPGRYAKKMTPAQRQWVEQADAIEREKLDFLQRNGIEINELSFVEGGQYAGRRVFAKVRMTAGEPEILEAGFVGAGPGRPGAKLAAEKQRIFETAEEAIEAGFRYLPEDEALYLNISGAYNRVADKQMADWLLLRVPWRTTGAPEELKLATYAAKQKLNKSRMLRAALNRAVRGERVPDATINSIASAYPEQAARLKALIPKLQTKQPRTATEVQALTREADDLIRGNQVEWYKARSATARAREKAMVPAFGEAAIPAPAFAGKILTGPEAKETAKVIMESLSPGFDKALGAVNKVNAIARFFMLAGDFSPMTIQLLFLMGQNPKIYAKAGLGLIRALFDQEFHANYLTKHNSTIQKSRNLIITKSGATEFTEAMARGGYLAPDRKLWPAEEKLFKKVPLLVPRAIAKVGAIVLQPFQRAFEGSLDVAGIELRESLDYMCTTPERTAGVEQFINEFRGLTSSARIGVSVSTRQKETVAVLAPRYNRAIAALLFDVSRGTIRGELARKSLAKGVAALVALTVAISYARGEDTEEVLDHLNPTSPNFMTWQVAGQKIGPGSKVRSVIKLFGQSSKDPEKLFELSMDNPGLRWIRGNLAPAISIGYDLLTGRDYIGDPTRDGMLSFTKTVAERFMPIWTQTVLLEGGTIGERAIRGAAEFLGMRGYPDPWGKLADMRDAEAMRRHNRPYDELNLLQQKEIKQTPGIKELQEQSEAESARRATGFRGEVDNFFAEGDRIETYRSEKLWEIHNQLKRGGITRGDANSAYWQLGQEISGMYEARDRDPRYDKVREYLEERATEKEKEQEGKEIYPGDQAYYEYQNLFAQADAEGWSSEEIGQRIEMLWRKYPGAEQYVTQLQEVGKDWPPSYIQYRRNRGKGTTGRSSLVEQMMRAKTAGATPAPPTGYPGASEAVAKWQAVRPSLNVAMLRGLEGLWYRGESLPPQVEAQLRQVHQRHSFGQPNFNAWTKQTLRQIFENAVMKSGK